MIKSGDDICYHQAINCDGELRRDSSSELQCPGNLLHYHYPQDHHDHPFPQDHHDQLTTTFLILKMTLALTSLPCRTVRKSTAWSGGTRLETKSSRTEGHLCQTGRSLIVGLDDLNVFFVSDRWFFFRYWFQTQTVVPCHPWFKPYFKSHLIGQVQVPRHRPSDQPS